MRLIEFGVKQKIKINQFIFIEGNVNNVYVHQILFMKMKN